MQLADISFHPPRRTLQQFAGLWILFFAAWGCWFLWGRDETGVALALFLVAGVVGLPSLFEPRLIRLIFVGWMCLAFPIGWLVSHVLLGFVFYGLFTPFALVFRLIGRDPLAIRSRRDDNTYWIPKPTTGDVSSYYRQS